MHILFSVLIVVEMFVLITGKWWIMKRSPPVMNDKKEPYNKLP
jgi:hypothetical protein